jgi:predicted nucleotidyltransferase
MVSLYESYLAAWRERWAQERLADGEAAAAARQVADRLAALLRDRYRARRVILVGSLARGEFRIGSDIDLAAEGIPDDCFFRAGADLDRAAGGIQVDLVPLESATASYLDCVAREGVDLLDARRSQ